MSELCLLNLVVSPGAADSVTDWLFMNDTVPGFTSTPVFGHGSSEKSMTLAEQVAGHQKKILFQIRLSSSEAYGILASIKQDFRGSGMHYWLLPVLDSGHLD